MVRRAASALVKGVVLFATFVAALVAGVFLHLGTGVARREIAARANAMLAEMLVGRVTIERIGSLSLHGVSGVDAVVRDESGRQLLRVDGLSANLDLPLLVASLRAGGAAVVHVTSVRVDAIDACVDADAGHTLALQRAVASKKPSAPSKTEVLTTIDELDVGHVWAHGVVTGAPLVDVDLDGLHASARVAPGKTVASVEHLAVLARGLPTVGQARGRITAHLEMPSQKGSPFFTNIVWHGAVGGIGETIDAHVDGGTIDAAIDAPSIEPDAVHALWPASVLDKVASFRAKARGTLPRLDVAVESTLGDASLSLKGPVTIAEGQRADLELALRHVDVHTLDAEAPASSLDARGTIAVARAASGAIDARVGLDFEGGPVGGRRAPAARFDVTAKRDAAGVAHAEVKIVSRDPGLPATVAARITPKGKGYEAAFDVEARAPRLEGIAWLPPVASGSTHLSTRGVLDLDRKEITAHAAAELDEVERGELRVHHADVTLDARGSLASPVIDATIRSEELKIGAWRIETVHLESHGPLDQAHVALSVRGGSLPDIDGDADVAARGRVAVRNVSFVVTRGDVKATTYVDELTLVGRTLRLDNALVDGLGAPTHLSLEVSPDSLRVRASGTDTELARLATLFRLEDKLHGGRVSFDVDVAIDRRGAKGRMAFDLANASVSRLDGVGAHLEAALDGRRVSGKLHMQLSETGWIEFATTGLEFGGNAPILASWHRAWGRVTIAGHMSVERALALLPKGTEPPFDANGEVTLRGTTWRDSPTDDTLGLALHVTTAGLSLVGRSDDELGDAAPWRLDGVDTALDLRIDGDTGFAEIAGRVNDTRGELVELEAKADTVPYGKLLSAQSDPVAALRDVAFNAHVLLPRRDVTTYPSLVAIPGAHGELAAKIDLHGPLDHLSAEATATIARAKLESTGIFMPFDVSLDAAYDGATALAKLSASAKGREVLTGSARVDLPASALLDTPPSAPLPWRAAMRAHLASFPLESVRPLSDRQVKGQVTGELAVTGLHADGRAGVTVDLRAVQVGDVLFPAGTLRLTIDGHALDATARLDQDDKGYVDVTAHAGATWGAKLAPALDPKAPLQASVVASRLRAEALMPFVDSTFTELDARIDANTKVLLDPVARAAKLEGTVTMKEGRFELASMGGEFHDATATIRFSPDGTVTLENARALATSGRVEAGATLHLDSAGLASADAKIVIPKDAPLLLSVEGSNVGTVDGEVDVAARASADRRTLAVDVTVPSFDVQLPMQTARQVQLLGPIEGVRYGATRGKEFQAVALDPAATAAAKRSADATKIEVTIDLHNIEVKRGSTLHVILDGKPTVTMTQDLAYGGQVRVREGTVDVQGKAFTIEKGTITFVGNDVTNPQVVLTASWQADDDQQTKVYADFIGPLKTGKVTLRSEPALSKNEILSLLLFGTTDGMGGTGASQPGSQQGTAVAGAAAGAATQPVNRALEQFGLGGVSTRVDTSSPNPRPEVEVQISRSLSVQIAVVLGAPPPGSNPDSTLLTVDWRFLRAWSLATTVGDQGTSIFDVIWHYRY